MSVPIGRRHEHALVLVFFAALTLVLTYPLSLQPGSASVGSDPDVHTYTWTLGWDVHALVHRPWRLFDANIFFPYPRTLAFSENLIGNVPFAAPVIWLTGNYVLAMNVVAMASVILCGAGAYLLARRIGLSPGAAAVCGLVFAFSPARFFRFQQIHLTAIQWMPYTLAFLHTYLDGGRQRDLRLAIAFFVLQALSSLHGVVYLTIAIAVVLGCRVAQGAPIAARHRLRDAGVAGVLLLLPLVVVAVPYLQVQREMGLVRTLENWIPTPESFVASPTRVHSWMLARVFDESLNSRASAFLFPGFVPIALTLAALISVRVRANRHALVVYSAIIAVAVLLCAGPPLSIWPYVYWLPGFNFIRIPSRFFLLAVLGIAVAAGIGFDRLAAGLRPAAQRAMASAAGLLLIVEFAAVPLPLTPYTVEFAPVDRWVATRPEPLAIAEVPVGPTTRWHSTYMLHSMAHWQKTVHGHSSLLPPLHEDLYDKLRNFPDDASLDMLSAIGVGVVVVHIDLYPPGQWDMVERAIERFAARLEPLYADSTGRVYRIK